MPIAFPAEFKGSAFVTLHGSWNRGRRTGYKVVRLPFRNGKPTGEYEDFMTGFGVSERQGWGRPVGIGVAKDGALFGDGRRQRNDLARLAFAGGQTMTAQGLELDPCPPTTPR